MPRYIEEETFVNFVQEHFCNGCNNYNGVKCRSCSVDDAISFVESAPTAEVVARAEFDRVANELKRVENLYFAKVAQAEVGIDAMRGAANSYKMHYEIAKKETERLEKEIKALHAFKDYFADLYGNGLAIANYHQNGNLEDFDNFYDSAEEEYEGELKKKYCGEGESAPTKVKSGDICVICGEPVPEGRQVCGMCEVGQAFLDKKKE